MTMKKTIFLFASLLISGLLILSIPMMNILLQGGFQKKEIRIVAKAEIRKVETPREKEKPRKQLKSPERPKPTRTQLKAGPRFAMDLSVSGLGGVAVDFDPAQRKGDGGTGGQNGDVDERPAPGFPPPFRIPADVKAGEVNAFLALSFCVDAGGRPYDIQVVEERPAGLGMAQAGREALRQTTFAPARKDGLAVAFCGLEQPFEVRFND